MSYTYSPDQYQCPHCGYYGLMYFGDTYTHEGIEWVFYVCPGCSRWVAQKEEEGLIRLMDLPFSPLGLQRPII